MFFQLCDTVMILGYHCFFRWANLIENHNQKDIPPPLLYSPSPISVANGMSKNFASLSIPNPCFCGSGNHDKIWKVNSAFYRQNKQKQHPLWINSLGLVLNKNKQTLPNTLHIMVWWLPIQLYSISRIKLTVSLI